MSGLSKLLSRAQQIQKCYKKYCISTDVLEAVFSQVDGILQSVSHEGSIDDITQLINSIIESQQNMERRQPCLNTMHDQVAEIEGLTLNVGEFDVESIDRK